MKKRLTDKSGEVRELTSVDFNDAVAFDKLPDSLKKKLAAIKNNVGRPKAESAKAMISFRFSPDLLKAIKSLGKGYNSKVEAVLRMAFMEKKI